MADLDPARREELAQALGLGAYEIDPLVPMFARWLADARAEGAAEVRARVEAVITERAYAYRDAPHADRAVESYAAELRAALADPTPEETP